MNRSTATQIPTFASTREDAVWAAVCALRGFDAANKAVEAYRDRLQHAEMERARIPSEEGPAHV